LPGLSGRGRQSDEIWDDEKRIDRSLREVEDKRRDTAWLGKAPFVVIIHKNSPRYVLEMHATHHNLANILINLPNFILSNPSNSSKASILPSQGMVFHLNTPLPSLRPASQYVRLAVTMRRVTTSASSPGQSRTDVFFISQMSFVHWESRMRQVYAKPIKKVVVKKPGHSLLLFDGVGGILAEQMWSDELKKGSERPKKDEIWYPLFA
jgi:hypothetical protein